MYSEGVNSPLIHEKFLLYFLYMNTYSPDSFEQELQLFNQSLEEDFLMPICDSQGSFDNYNEYTKGSRLSGKRAKGKKHKREREY